MTRLTIGAAWGAVAWLIYGAVELILSTGIQLWPFPAMEILGWQWRLIAMLMGAYAVIGLVVGAVGGIVAGAAPQVFASFTIISLLLMGAVVGAAAVWSRLRNGRARLSGLRPRWRSSRLGFLLRLWRSRKDRLRFM